MVPSSFESGLFSGQRRRLPQKHRQGEGGYILLGVLILVALFAMALAIAAPIVAKDLERDKEVEAVHRGTQYKRAIKLYYKRFGSYPVSIKQLEETNNIRFLRKRYVDPITGKDDWRIIHVGEAKVPVMGFFGQPLQAGMSSVSTGLNGNGTGGLGTPAGSSGTLGSSSSFGNTGSSFGGSTIGSSGSTSSSGTGDVSAGGGSGAPAGVLPGMGGGAAGSGTNSSTGTSVPGGATGAGTSGLNGSTMTGSGGSGFDGGGPIVGVGLPKTQKSLVVYKKQDAFNKWEFTYDPIEEQQTVSSSNIPGATGAGTNVSSPGSTASSTSPFGSSSGSATGGSSTSGSGSSNSNTGSSGSGSSSTSGTPPQN